MQCYTVEVNNSSYKTHMTAIHTKTAVWKCSLYIIFCIYTAWKEKLLKWRKYEYLPCSSLSKQLILANAGHNTLLFLSKCFGTCFLWLYFVTATKPQAYSPAKPAAVTRHLLMLLCWQVVKEAAVSCFRGTKAGWMGTRARQNSKIVCWANNTKQADSKTNMIPLKRWALWWQVLNLLSWNDSFHDGVSGFNDDLSLLMTQEKTLIKPLLFLKPLIRYLTAPGLYIEKKINSLWEESYFPLSNVREEQFQNLSKTKTYQWRKLFLSQ